MVSPKSRRSQKWIIVLIVAAIALAYFAVTVLGDRLNKKLISAKMYHETTATVIRKEVVRFDDFNGYDEPLRSQLMQTEKKRVSDGRPHFMWRNYNDRSWYDTVKVGDKLIVSYKAYSDGAIDILHAEKFGQ